MPRFACPSCSAVVEASREDAGTKFSCPTCGLELEIPSVARQTVLARPLDPLTPERRQKLSTGILAASLMLLGLAVAVLVVGVTIKGDMPPKAQAGESPREETKAQEKRETGAHVSSQQAENWTHKELFEYLRRSQLIKGMCHTKKKTAGPAMWFSADETDPKQESLDGGWSSPYFDVLVIRMPSPKAASDEASGRTGVNKPNRMPWGPWVFEADKTLLQKVQAALAGKKLVPTPGADAPKDKTQAWINSVGIQE